MRTPCASRTLNLILILILVFLLDRRFDVNCKCNTVTCPVHVPMKPPTTCLLGLVPDDCKAQNGT